MLSAQTLQLGSFSKSMATAFNSSRLGVGMSERTNYTHAFHILYHCREETEGGVTLRMSEFAAHVHRQGL
eukprot:3963187-Amphidinium_carterae.2